MKRIFVLGGAWSVVLMVAGVCLADNTRKQQYQAAPAAAPGAGARYVQPAGGNWNGAARASAAQAARAQAAAAAQPSAAARNAVLAQSARAQSAAAQSAQSAATQRGYNYGSYNPYGAAYPSYGYPGYGYGSGGYGYSPYGYPYSPYGTTPYVLGYNPYTGQSYLFPATGGYFPYSPYGYRYPYYSNPYLGIGYPGAVFVNPGQLFGIGPVQQLMGVGGWFAGPNVAPQGNGNFNNFGNINGNAGFAANANPGFAAGGNNAAAGNNPGPAAKAVAGDVPAPPKPAAGGGKALELAWKFIAFGDAQFADLKFNEALDRYRRATREDPKLGDAWFREGFALAALGQYSSAAKAIRRGLEEKPDWVDDNFKLDEIYGDNGGDKKAAVARSVRASEAEPTNGDMALVAAVQLFCDGRAEQAVSFFRRAAKIQGSDADVKSFLAKVQQ